MKTSGLLTVIGTVELVTSGFSTGGVLVLVRVIFGVGEKVAVGDDFKVAVGTGVRLGVSVEVGVEEGT